MVASSFRESIIVLLSGPLSQWFAGRPALSRRVSLIGRARERLERLSDAALSAEARSWAFRLRGRPAGPTEVDAVFALATEAIRRALGLSLYPVQLLAGLWLQSGVIVEMQTGEGKTVTAVPPVTLWALQGQGCHVMTANEYLAQRDADKLRPVYRLLGLSVGCVTGALEPPARRAAYDCDITYGTAGEFGFDYLRDRLALPPGTPGPERPTTRLGAGVQRGLAHALIDEADSLLLDESRTPLIIALPMPDDEGRSARWRWARSIALGLREPDDYVWDRRTKQIHLTQAGCRRVLLTTHRLPGGGLDQESVYEHVETALLAEHAYQRDRDYMIDRVDEEPTLLIVDESTGRSLDGRRWQHGLHQAIEAKEGIPHTTEQGVAASITLQRFLGLYLRLAGMTGTAWTARAEFRRLYRRRVVRIPTHRPQRRAACPTRIFATMAAKHAAIVAEVRAELARGRPILIGTPSIEASEALSAALVAAAIPHRVLNARRHAAEAEIVALAGLAPRVTIATNMAGRGTDIELAPATRSAGGLHVIATELHTSRRIDRQLIGRAARQGDPGSYRFLLSVEDELLVNAPLKTRLRWLGRAAAARTAELSTRHWLPLFRRLQRAIERRHARERRRLKTHEHQRWKLLLEMGLDPTLDLVEER